jgi:iterative type I PKS product template protein
METFNPASFSIPLGSNQKHHLPHRPTSIRLQHTRTPLAKMQRPNARKYDISASCQRIISKTYTANTAATLTIRSCVADPGLWPVLRDHKCNGVTLTPSGLYGDMAITVTKHIWAKARQGETLPGLNVCEMHVDKPLKAQNPQIGEGQWLEMKVTAEDLDGAGMIHCSFSHVSPQGVKIDDLAHCIVRLEDEALWRAEWSTYAPTILSQIERLQARALKETTGQIRTIRRRKAYELFKTFVEYDGDYQAMSEIIIDKAELEATALLDIMAKEEGELSGPYYLDGSCHLSGFICNASDEDTKKNAYISHGWDAAKISSDFQPGNGKELRSYVRMRAEGKDVLGGTVLVIQGSEIVGTWEGVRFKRIPRRVLNVFLPPPRLAGKKLGSV